MKKDSVLNLFSESAAYRLRSAYLRMHRNSNRVFRAYGVTADQYVVLRLLSEGDGISQQELASLCASDPTTVGRMLDLLEQGKLVERRPHAADRRTRLVFLTPAGYQKMAELYDAAESIRTLINTSMSEAEMTAMMQGLLLFSSAFEQLENGDVTAEEMIR